VQKFYGLLFSIRGIKFSRVLRHPHTTQGYRVSPKLNYTVVEQIFSQSPLSADYKFMRKCSLGCSPWSCLYKKVLALHGVWDRDESIYCAHTKSNPLLEKFKAARLESAYGAARIALKIEKITAGGGGRI
jgi:hypothetical protein